MTWRADLTLVAGLVERELTRFRRKELPHIDAVAIRVLWVCREDPDRYGEFIGTPLADYSVYDSGQLQNEIVVYAKPLIADFGRAQTLAREVRITILHEFGHAFGFDEDDLADRGLD